MPKESPLAAKTYVTAEDISKYPLITPSVSASRSSVENWIGNNTSSYHIAARYNQMSAAVALFQAGFGYLVCLKGAEKFLHRSNTVFRPFGPSLLTRYTIIWRNDRTIGHTAQTFVDYVVELEKTGGVTELSQMVYKNNYINPDLTIQEADEDIDGVEAII